MAPNTGTILFFILYSWTHITSSSKTAASTSLSNKEKYVIFSSSRCCRMDKSLHKSHKGCWCTDSVEGKINNNNNIVKHYDNRLSHQLQNFQALELVLQRRSSQVHTKTKTVEQNQSSILGKHNLVLDSFQYGNRSRISDISRNRTLGLILQRISKQLSSKSSRDTPVSSRHLVFSLIPKQRMMTNSTRTFDSIRQTLSTTPQRSPSFLPKRSWNRSYSKNVFVFGRDDRTQITSSLQRKFPYSNMVRLSTGCTGTLITPFHVLTAAHCVHNGREFLNKLEMMKVEVPDAIGVRAYYMEKIGIPDRWLNPISRNYQQASFDYAVVRLSYGVHGRYRFLPLSVPTEATLRYNLQFLGFPNYGYGLWRSVCPARTTKSFMDGNLILARCDSAIGNSGAAIFTTDFRSEKSVIGVLSSTVSMGDNPLYQRYSVITALTETKLLDICTEIGPIGVYYGVCPSPDTMAVRREGFQRKIKIIPFFG